MRESPSVQRLVSVAHDLGPLAAQVVFIGGAIAPLLHTDSVLPRTRPTKDVDGVIATHSYGESARIFESLRTMGFAQNLAHGGHAHRWQSPGGHTFDLVPAGAHLGGSGNEWDQLALLKPESFELDGVRFLHASAPAFVALKIAAHRDRGGSDARASHDFEDMVALIASRASIVSEVAAAPAEIRSAINAFARDVLADTFVDDLLVSHLNNADDPAELMVLVKARLEGLARV